MKKQNDKEIKIYVHPMLFLIIKVLQLVQFVDDHLDIMQVQRYYIEMDAYINRQIKKKE